MLNQDYIAKLLNLEDAIIKNVENKSDQLFIQIELPRKMHICPACGRQTGRAHDYRKQIIKDIPLGRSTFLVLRKRRYRCTCGSRFFEQNSFLPRYYRVTSRLVCAVIQAFEKVVSVKEIGYRYNISGMTAMRYFNCFNATPKELPEAISVDEFKGNSGGEKYNFIFADSENRKVLDILPDQHEKHLIQYFSQFDSKKNVKYFVCDINPHFRNVAKTCFPQAKIVADKYHVVRQVYWAMENVRKNEQKKLSANFRKYFKQSRSLLMKRTEKLSSEDMDALALMFEIAPRLAGAYRLKNEFLTVMRSSSSATGRERLKDWLFSVEQMEIDEFRACARACPNC